MTDSIVAHTSAPKASDAARELAATINAGLGGRPADAIILFASPRYDQGLLLRDLHAGCAPKLLVGSSSAGELTSEKHGEGLACALALRSDDLRFAAGVGRGLGEDRGAVARSIVSCFHGLDEAAAFRSALVMTDALAGHADDLVDQLMLATAGAYQFFGGGAGDDAQFRCTQVFLGTETFSDAAVALEIVSKKPVGIGVGHGWEPSGPKLRVTESRGMTLVSLNGIPAVEAFERHATVTEQPALDRANPIPFFLHNIIGIEIAGGHRLRVPLAVNNDGSIACAAEVPTGTIVHIMRTTAKSAVDAATRATAAALKGLRGNRPQVALFFDCVATRLRMGDLFATELRGLADALGDTAFVGCNTHGQIARADGQFSGFHNCTAVVCVLPE